VNLQQVQQELSKATSALKTAEAEKARAEGQLQSLQQQLKADFNVSTVEEAKKLIVDLNSDIQTLDVKIAELEAQLER